MEQKHLFVISIFSGKHMLDFFQSSNFKCLRMRLKLNFIVHSKSLIEQMLNADKLVNLHRPLKILKFVTNRFHILENTLLSRWKNRLVSIICSWGNLRETQSQFDITHFDSEGDSTGPRNACMQKLQYFTLVQKCLQQELFGLNFKLQIIYGSHKRCSTHSNHYFDDANGQRQEQRLKQSMNLRWKLACWVTTRNLLIFLRRKLQNT